MPEYRDYGKIGNNVTPNIEIDTEHYSQVFLATHEGESRLPFMKRSFISFSFGGKNIEDFNLLVISNNSYIEKNGYSNFEDITTEYDILDGHFYWGTHYTNYNLTFSLATDEITETQLEKFLAWFSAGKIRELILSEHPNRAIMARVSEAPQLKLSPFEKKVSSMIAGREYKTSTTVYRGAINLTLIAEEPFWYSKVNIFGYLGQDGIYHDTWYDANGIERSVYDDKDAIKIALEDNIPISGMIQNSMLLGDNKYANAEPTGAQTAPQDSYNDDDWNQGQLKDEMYVIAEVDAEGIWLRGARLAGTIISETGGILNFPPNENQYFYYAGNAPSAPIITFTLTPQFDINGYINSPANTKAQTNSTNGKKYNTISIESLNLKELNFTTPSVYTAYNQAIEIFSSMNVEQAWVEVRDQIRDKVKHPAVRAWSNKVISSFSNGLISSVQTSEVINKMKYFLEDNDGNMLPSTFIINNKTGQALGNLQYRDVNSTTISNWSSYGDIRIHEEDVGDMIYSNYLIIEDRNYPTKEGNVVAWTPSSEETKIHSHRIKHNVATGLKNFFITYKNMYL